MFTAVADQHYGLNFRSFPPFDTQTVIDWMHNPNLPDLDFVIASLGDWISDDRMGPWADVRYTWQRITELNADHQLLPYFFIIGNHDITNYQAMPSDGNPVLKERLGRSISGLNENNFSFMYNNVLFISVAQTNVLYHLSQFQKNWLEYLAGRHKDHTTVILTHQATFETTGSNSQRATSWTDNDYRVHCDHVWWRKFFANNHQIRLYLHGHTEEGVSTVADNLHGDVWDDHCTFVLVPCNAKRHYSQWGWSCVFTIADRSIAVRIWDTATSRFLDDPAIGVPYERAGNFNVHDTGLEWFSIPKRVLDGQEWDWSNRMLARNYSLELVGSTQTEQIDNPRLDMVHEIDEEKGDIKKGYWYAVRGDKMALNKATGSDDGFIEIAGGNTCELAASSSGSPQKCIEGKVPYNTAIAVPGKTYEFKARIRTTNGIGSVDFLMSIPRRTTVTDHVWLDQPIAQGNVVDSTYRTISSTFSVPGDRSAWFLQPKIEFHDPLIVYQWDEWSLKMLPEGEFTESFRVNLNGQDFGSDGVLKSHQVESCDVPAMRIGNRLSFKASVDGNRVGLMRLIYRRPLFWSDDVSIGVLNAGQDRIYLEDVSPYNGRTSVMTFKNVAHRIVGPGFYRMIVRGKWVYLNDRSDATINGIYSVR